MFGYEVTNVYRRAEIITRSHFLGPSLDGLRQAWFSDQADRLIAIRYDSLVERPCEIVDTLYDLLGEERFPHNFDNVEYDEPEFDARLAMPGFHRVSGKVTPRPRETILPPDLFAQCNQAFWELPDQNPRGVKIL
jgi:sulfotransferase